MGAPFPLSEREQGSRAAAAAMAEPKARWRWRGGWGGGRTAPGKVSFDGRARPQAGRCRAKQKRASYPNLIKGAEPLVAARVAGGTCPPPAGPCPGHVSTPQTLLPTWLPGWGSAHVGRVHSTYIQAQFCLRTPYHAAQLRSGLKQYTGTQPTSFPTHRSVLSRPPAAAAPPEPPSRRRAPQKGEIPAPPPPRGLWPGGLGRWTPVSEGFRARCKARPGSPLPVPAG